MRVVPSSFKNPGRKGGEGDRTAVIGLRRPTRTSGFSCLPPPRYSSSPLIPRGQQGRQESAPRSRADQSARARARVGVQSRLDLAPVVIGRPIAREFLNRRQLHVLRLIRDRLPFRPLCRAYAPAQFGQFRFRNIHMKRTNRILVSGLLAALLCSTGVDHGALRLRVSSALECQSQNVLKLALHGQQPAPDSRRRHKVPRRCSRPWHRSPLSSRRFGVRRGSDSAGVMSS